MLCTRFECWFWPLMSCNHVPWLIGSHRYTLHGNKSRNASLTESYHLLSNICWKTKAANVSTCEPLKTAFIWSYQCLPKSTLLSYTFWKTMVTLGCLLRKRNKTNNLWWLCKELWLHCGLVLASKECRWCGASEARRKPSEFSEVLSEGGLTLLSCLRVCSVLCYVITWWKLLDWSHCSCSRWATDTSQKQTLLQK